MVRAGSLTAEGPGRGLASCRLGSGAIGPHFPKMQLAPGVSGAGGSGLAVSLYRSLGSQELCSLVLAAPSCYGNSQCGVTLQLTHEEGMETEAQVTK